MKALPFAIAWLLAAGASIAADDKAADKAVPPEFRGADLALGERLIREHKCSECHIRRVGGDGSAIYRPTGRIGRPAALISMVEYCSTELKLQLFPEDVQAVAAVLQRDHYRFRAAP
jgi:cytochrome c2